MFDLVQKYFVGAKLRSGVLIGSEISFGTDFSDGIDLCYQIAKHYFESFKKTVAGPTLQCIAAAEKTMKTETHEL